MQIHQSSSARLAAAGLLCLALACSSKPPSPDQTPAAASDTSPPVSDAGLPLDGREWSLVALGDAAAPAGAGGRPATIQFDMASGRASGFAGCNRYSASFTVEGGRLTFGPAMSTKMACEDGDELERRYLPILTDVTGYQQSDSTLSLVGAGGSLARFRGQ